MEFVVVDVSGDIGITAACSECGKDLEVVNPMWFSEEKELQIQIKPHECEED